MPLIPELALQGRVPQIPIPDFAQTALMASQIQAQRNQEAMRMVQLSELLRQRQLSQQAAQYASRIGQPGALRTDMAAQVPQAAPGIYVRPSTDFSTVTPPAGTTYTRAPEAMQPAREAPATPQGLLQFEQPGIDMLNAYQRARSGEAKAEEDRIETYVKRLDAVAQMLGVPSDQASYDEMKQEMRQVAPGFLKLLPPLYDKDKLVAIQHQMMQAKVRAKAQGMGMTPIPMQGPGGKYGVGVLTPAGDIHLAGNPPGYEPLPTTQLVNQGTQIQPVARAGGAPVGAPYPIDVAGKAEQEVTGKGGAEYEVTFPQRQLEAERTIARWDQKFELSMQKITDIMNAIKDAKWTPTGKLGALGRVLNIPGPMNVGRLTDTLRSQTGLDELVNLKTVSKAGLGQVSNEEGARLENSIAQINPDKQTDAQLWDSLHTLSADLTRTRQRLKEEYHKEFVQQQGRPPASGRAPAAPGRGRELTKQDIAETLADPRNKGKTEEDIIRDARSKGYTYQGR